MSILDHVGLPVRDYARSKAFYEKVLATLGLTLLREYGKIGGFGRDGKPELWIAEGPASYQSKDDLARITPIHVALCARSRAEVDAFHEAALANGGKDFGAPGLREIYHPNYYGAFVIDLDGHNVEAVVHKPE